MPQRSHHQPKNHKESTHHNKKPGVSTIKNRPGEYRGEGQEEALDCSYPGYGAVGVGGEVGCEVEGLEGAVGCYYAPGVEVEHEAG